MKKIFISIILYSITKGACADAFLPSVKKAEDHNSVSDLSERKSNEEITTHRRAIVGGYPAEDNAYPAYAVPRYNGQMCGATLIHSDILLTAAHCTDAFARGAMLGMNDLVEKDFLEKIETEFYYPHPRYNDWTYANDVMLIKLIEPSNLTLTPLNFDPGMPINGGNEVLTAIGFGHLEFGGEVTDILMEVELNEIDSDTCSALYSGHVDDDIMLCAGVDGGGYGVCSGDSGGPLYAEDGSQVGIVSWGRGGCAAESFPPVFARVSAFKDFIQMGICEFSEYPPDYCREIYWEMDMEDLMCPEALYGCSNRMFRGNGLIQHLSILGRCLELCLPPSAMNSYGWECGACP